MPIHLLLLRGFDLLFLALWSFEYQLPTMFSFTLEMVMQENNSGKMYKKGNIGLVLQKGKHKRNRKVMLPMER